MKRFVTFVWLSLAAAPLQAQISINLPSGFLLPSRGQSDVLDFATLGVPDDENYDNTPRLLEALQRRTAKGERYAVYIPAGDWWFLTPLPIAGNEEDFRNATIFGAASALNIQHLEDGGWNDDSRRRTRLRYKTATEQIFWNQTDTVRFGPVCLRDFILSIENRGSGFAFGDPANTTTSYGAARGIDIKGVAVTRLKHYQSGDVGDGRPWLVNAGGTIGWVLNRNCESFGFRFHQTYETQLDVSTRGVKTGVIDSHNDALRGKIRAFTVGKMLDSYSLPTAASVGSLLDTIYLECPLIVGAVINGQVGKVRVENGYQASTTSAGGTPIGNYALPANIGWTATAGAPAITFSGFAAGYDARDYFEPRTVIRLNPDNAGEPDRYLLITEVTASAVKFYNATSSSYISRDIAGAAGTSVTRFFGTAAIAYGDRASVALASLGNNDAITDFPLLFLAPEKMPLRWPANVESPGESVADATTWPRVIASSAGVQHTLAAGVDWLGSASIQHHPLINHGGIGPDYNANAREPIRENGLQIYKPGRGVIAGSNQSRDLTFHFVTNEDGKQVATYRPSDHAQGWLVSDLTYSAVSTDVTAHVYVASGTPTLRFYGGGSLVTEVLAAGWQTVTKTLSGGNMTGDVIGVTTTGGDAYIESIIVEQTP